MEPGDKLVCTYTSKGEPQRELWERPDHSRYTIEVGTGVRAEGIVATNYTKTSYTFNSCKHKPGGGVAVGDFKVYPFSYSDSQDVDCLGLTHIYALTSCLYSRLYHEGFKGVVYGVAFPDQDVLPDKAHRQVIESIVTTARKGLKIGFYCMGGHGRTGAILGSLIALVEKPEDPIKVVRERYCKQAIESKKQAERVFAMVGKPLPSSYEESFTSSYTAGSIDGGICKSYGFSWWERDKYPLLPAWMKGCAYADMPLRSEIDRGVRQIYQSFSALKLEHQAPFLCVEPSLAPASEVGTWWVIDPKGHAVRVAFHKVGFGDGTILEYRECLAKEERPYVSIIGELLAVEKPKSLPLTRIHQEDLWPF